MQPHNKHVMQFGLVAVILLILATTTYAVADFTPTDTVYMPVVANDDPLPVFACPTTSTRSYGQGPIKRFEYDNPIRPAEEHADRNIELRTYTLNTSSNLMRELVDYGSSTATQPPQFATMFEPVRVPPLANFYQVGGWWWEPSPDPGHFWTWIESPVVTAMGLDTETGEELHTPASGKPIGGGQQAMVIYADEDSVVLRYTREDTAGYYGYTMHVDNICVDPNLLSLYRYLDRADGPRYTYVPPENGEYWYDLPHLATDQVFGTASEGETVVIMLDSGSIMDPRSCDAWWQIRPGYTSTCPSWQPGR